MDGNARTTRLLGAAVVFAVALLLFARYGTRGKSDIMTDAAAVASAQAPAVASPRIETGYSGARIDGLSTGSSSALAVGERGLILRRRTTDPTWDAMTSPAHVALHAVAQQLDGAIAVGDDGTIAELDGETWRLAPAVTPRTLRAVVYSSYGVIAVGDGGTIVRRAAPSESWRVEPSGTTADLLGACSGLREVWIVGARGTTLEHAPIGSLGDMWKVHASGTNATLRAVACDDNAAIAVGDGGALLQRGAEVDWHELPNATKSDLLAVGAPVGARSWLAVGVHGTLVRIAGEPVAQPNVVDWSFRAVTEGALGTWIGGDEGIVRLAH